LLAPPCLVAQGGLQHLACRVVRQQLASEAQVLGVGFLPHGDNSEKKANFEKLQAYLLNPDAQQALLKLGAGR
jgi:hypothetical protein